MSDLAGPVNQFGSAFLVPARNALSACLGTFGHFGDVQMCASAVYDAYCAISGSYGPRTYIVGQFNLICVVHYTE